MALYGLSVFLETPRQLRKGRKPYIVASFCITALAALTASVDMASYFHILFDSISARNWLQLYLESERSWERMLNVGAMGCLLLIADGLLVSVLDSISCQLLEGHDLLP